MSPILYGLIVTVFGMVIVFLVLIALWGILTMMRTLFGGKKKQNNEELEVQNKVIPVVAAAAAVSTTADEMDADELIAVITAALYASMGSQSSLAVRSITRVGSSTPIWGQIGRHEQTLNRF